VLYTVEALITNEFDDYDDRRLHFFRRMYMRLIDTVFKTLQPTTNPTYPIRFISRREDEYVGIKRAELALYIFTPQELKEYKEKVISEYRLTLKENK